MKSTHTYEREGTEYQLSLVENTRGEKEIRVKKDGIPNTYVITKEWCTCPGYRYHRKCHHRSTAEGTGMLNQLPDRVKKEKSVKIEDSRRQAVEAYGKAHNWGSALIEWALKRMPEYNAKNKSVDDLVKDFNKQRRRAK